MNQLKSTIECKEEMAGVWIKDLWYVVDSVKANFGITANTHDKRFFKFAMDVYRDMSLANVMKTAIRTVHIPTPADYFYEHQQMPAVWPPLGPEQAIPPVRDCFKQVRLNLPVDFIDWHQVAIDCHGYLQPLDYNENIITTQMEVNGCCGNELEQCLERDRLCNCGEGFGINGGTGGGIGWSYYDWGFSPYWKNGQFIGGAYGRSAYRYKGAFNIDTATKQIVLDRHTRPLHGIVLVYLSNGIGNGNVNIENGTEDALIAGVEWKKQWYEYLARPAREQSKLGLAAVGEAKKIYHNQIKRVNARKMAMTASEIHNVVLKSIRQTPKR